MNYQQTLNYLYQFIGSQRTRAATPQTAAQKLDRMHLLLEKIALATVPFPCIIVAGTNGKGSTCAMLESILRTAGYRTGLWTSPHLCSYRERIQVNRQMISRPSLVEAVQRIKPVIDAFDTSLYGTPTTFELGFALALTYFAEQQVHCAILEVGLGGRYDCANVLTPLVSAICSIGYDHMDILGSTLTRIAYDKAGIMKPGIPTITVPQQEEAATVLAAVATEVEAVLWMADERGISPPGEATGTRSPQPYSVAPDTPLYGLFQQENARLALGLAMLLREKGFVLSSQVMAQGLATVQWSGRMEVVAEQPLVLLDGAHNPDSAEKLLCSLETQFTFERLILILGTSRDKHFDRMAATLVPHARILILTHSSHPRAETNLDMVADVVKPHLHGILFTIPDIAAALDKALSLATLHDIICVTGSLFVVGAARAVLGLAPESD
jgi:dihydrofolate synthase/folylpolyglutamate synthase